MRGLGKLLLGAVSVGALATTHIAALTAKQKPAPFAPTPRKPEFKRRRKVASAARAKRREVARAKFDRQLRKEREIGVDPIFRHRSRDRRMAFRASWLAKSKIWDRQHG